MIVFEYKACTLQYFLDDMQPYELNIILSMLEYTTKQDWEQTRFQSYITAQSQSTKKLSIDDILHFTWEDKKNDDKCYVSKDDIKRLTEKANKITQEKINKVNGKS